MRSLDTTTSAAMLQLAIHKRLGSAGRLRVAIEISDLLRELAEAGVRQRLSEWNPLGGNAMSGTPSFDRDENRQSISALFLRLRAALESAGVPYMLTGSFASSIHGTPRGTQDIDIVIAPSRPRLLALLARLPEAEYYVSRDAALDALIHHEQFNVIDIATGWKVDFIIRKPRPFSRTEFERRRAVELSGVEVDVASAEDVLIAKLERAKRGSSARQIEDAAGIIHLQGERLDTDYVERWVEALGLEQQWRAARTDAD